jgi:hypothetical protein
MAPPSRCTGLPREYCRDRAAKEMFGREFGAVTGRPGGLSVANTVYRIRERLVRSGRIWSSQKRQVVGVVGVVVVVVAVGEDASPHMT